MKALRMLGATLVWVVAALLGLVGGLLCLTIILIPLGVPVLILSAKIFAIGTAMVVPRSVRHPMNSAQHQWGSARSSMGHGIRRRLQGRWWERLLRRKPRWRRKLGI